MSRLPILEGANERATCQLCGHQALFLGPHLNKIHKMSAAEYRHQTGQPVWGPKLQAAFAGHALQSNGGESTSHRSMLLELLTDCEVTDRALLVAVARQLVVGSDQQFRQRLEALLADSQEGT